MWLQDRSMLPGQQMLLDPVPKKYIISMSWGMCRTVEIEAFSEEEALELAYQEDLNEGEYLDDSFQVDRIEKTN